MGGFGRIKKLVAGVAVLAAVGVSALVGAQPAWAASADSVDSWTASYTVGADGVTHVQETVVYRFGSSSARHGIMRDLTTREAWGSTDQDAVYTISDIQVSSPDASAQFTTSTLGAGTRNQALQIQIGSANQTVTTPTATYTLSYDVTGAMRTDSGYDELYWDAIPDTTQVNDISITVTVPGGVQQAACFDAVAGKTGDCSSAQVNGDGTATYTVASKPANNIVTIGAMITSGLVSDNAPHLEPSATAQANASKARNRDMGLASTGVFIVVAAVLGTLFVRKRRTDQRFEGVAPGSFPASADAPTHADDHPTLPVSFAPPELPVAVAGLLEDGAVDVRDTTAALVSLAVRGAIQLRQEDGPSGVFGGAFNGGQSNQTVYGKLVNPSVPMAPHEAGLLRDIFKNQVGVEKSLSKPGTLARAHDHMRDDVREEAQRAGLYVRMPDRSLASTTGGATAASGIARLLMYAFVGVWFVGAAAIGGIARALAGASPALVVVGPLIVIVLALIICWALVRRGQRSAVGRAYTDQITGFREYLTTAEADQLKFEEGQDIFSQYLPWAIIYGVADRWAKVCQQLVAEGRLVMQPTWYYGDMRMFNTFMMMNMWTRMDAGSMPAAPAGGGGWSSSGSGFGGGSAFGGGGFAGGGGGGGGIGSW
jgi:uncharacterized membrane protein YgcG